MGYSVVHQYTYILYNDQTGVISTSVTINIHHFFVLRTFEVPSSRYIEIYITLLSPCFVIEHQNLILPSNCNFLLVDYSVEFLL